MAYDAILILGGGVREGGELPAWSKSRFDLALKRAQGEFFVCLSAATTHRPPPLDQGFPISESFAGARYLMQKGVIPARIRVENASFDTIGNAYLTKLIHVDPAGWQNVLVITSDFHMPRTKAIFEWIFGLEGDRYRLTFEASPNHGLSPEAVRARELKETERLDSLAQHRQRITSLRALHDWFFTEHEAYSAHGQWRAQRSSDADVLESY